MSFISAFKKMLISPLKPAASNCFDLTTIEGIRSIPPSAISKSHTFSTNQIEYVLQLKATEYKKAGKLDLAIECLRKSNELKPLSHTEYSAKDYYQLVEYLKLARRFDEAREEKANLDKLFDSNGFRIELVKAVQEKTTPKSTNASDLVEVQFVGCCCGECAKYRDRVYSYYGKDPRFPRFPQFLIDNPNHCGLMALPFYFEYNSFQSHNGKDLRGSSLIKYCNRPFVDNRSKEEKALYEKQINDAETERIDRLSYDWIWEHMPEICPKSYGGYRRMKNSNSTNFQKIHLKALENGFDILTGNEINKN